MSHKRPSKRSRSSTAEIAGVSSPSNEYFQPKRSKLDEKHDEASVRRSSRAPKPKLFDDEYVDILHSSLDDIEARGKKEKPLSPTKVLDTQVHGFASNVYESESSGRRKSSRAPKPKIFDEDFIDSPKSKLDVRTPGKEIIATYEEQSVTPVHENVKQQKFNVKEQKKDKSKSKITNEPPYGVLYSEEQTPKAHHKSRKSSDKLSHADSYLHEAAQYFTPPQTYSGNVSQDESPKVRQSSRTPKPKKTFALIDNSSYGDNEDNYEDNNAIDNIPKEIVTPKSGSKSSKRHSIEMAVPSELVKKKGKGKTESSSDEKSKKKSKKSKSDRDLPLSPTFSQEDLSDVMEEKNKRKERKKDGKEKSKKNSTKEVSKKSVDVKEWSSVSSTEKSPLKKQSMKKNEHKHKEEEVPSSPVEEKKHSRHSSSEHGKKSHSKHTKTKHDEPHSETKDEDQHIILKLHIPHPESPSHHTHSYKKHHKHKHHSSESKGESSPSEVKSKKQKLSFEASSSVSSEKTPKKKLSIKFKGLSSSEPDVEVDVESPFSPPSVMKEPVKKKKVKKPSQEGLTSPSIPSGQQEHVKVVIKKSKKDVKVLESGNEKKLSNKVKTQDKEAKSNEAKSKEAKSKEAKNKEAKSKEAKSKEAKSKEAKSKEAKSKEAKNKEAKTKPKEAVIVSKESTVSEAKPKSSPKKKSKTGGTPGKSPNGKEKKRNITGYLLFCKSERPHIAEDNPGFDFPQISQKVGEAWHSLTDQQKQKWKDKANILKAKLNINVEKKDEKKHEGDKSGPDVIDMAAHLKLLGESLSLIGVSLMAQRGTEVHGSLSVLLDSILCAICPLTFLTSHIPGIPGVAKEKQVGILDDLAYTMPGLG